MGSDILYVELFHRQQAVLDLVCDFMSFPDTDRGIDFYVDIDKVAG